jgi:hypothetical protein
LVISPHPQLRLHGFSLSLSSFLLGTACLCQLMGRGRVELNRRVHQKGCRGPLPKHSLFGSFCGSAFFVTDPYPDPTFILMPIRIRTRILLPQVVGTQLENLAYFYSSCINSNLSFSTVIGIIIFIIVDNIFNFVEKRLTITFTFTGTGGAYRHWWRSV